MIHGLRELKNHSRTHAAPPETNTFPFPEHVFPFPSTRPEKGECTLRNGKERIRCCWIDSAAAVFLSIPPFADWSFLCCLLFGSFAVWLLFGCCWMLLRKGMIETHLSARDRLMGADRWVATLLLAAVFLAAVFLAAVLLLFFLAVLLLLFFFLLLLLLFSCLLLGDAWFAHAHARAFPPAFALGGAFPHWIATTLNMLVCRRQIFLLLAWGSCPRAMLRAAAWRECFPPRFPCARAFRRTRACATRVPSQHAARWAHHFPSSPVSGENSVPVVASEDRVLSSSLRIQNNQNADTWTCRTGEMCGTARIRIWFSFFSAFFLLLAILLGGLA